MKYSLIIILLMSYVNGDNLSKSIVKFSTPYASTDKILNKQLGKKYIWGANGPKAFDCSGLSKFYVKKKKNKVIPRRAIAQSKKGKKISIKNIRKGDLLFFATTKKDEITHVGIYIGKNKFIHASSAKKKVVIGSLKDPFYKKEIQDSKTILIFIFIFIFILIL